MPVTWHMSDIFVFFINSQILPCNFELFVFKFMSELEIFLFSFLFFVFCGRKNCVYQFYPKIVSVGNFKVNYLFLKLFLNISF